MSDPWEALDRKSIKQGDRMNAIEEATKGSTGIRATQYERILTDLITKLRDAGRDQAMEESVIDLTELADTYERRLREVQGE